MSPRLELQQALENAKQQDALHWANLGINNAKAERHCRMAELSMNLARACQAEIRADLRFGIYR